MPAPDLKLDRDLKVPGYHVVGERGGVMVHFDCSSSDDSGVDYLVGLHGKKGYNVAVGDTGLAFGITSWLERAYHAGPCLTPNANSFYYGVAALTNEHHPVTPAQFERIAQLTAAFWRYHHASWGEPSPANLIRRVVGHDRQAIWTKDYTSNKALWGRLGRKLDPTGLPGSKGYPAGPILSVPKLRDRVAQLLNSGK